jgi:hypothetical protein
MESIWLDACCDVTLAAAVALDDGRVEKGLIGSRGHRAIAYEPLISVFTGSPGDGERRRIECGL